MKLRYQFYIFQIVLAALVFTILILNYNSYKKQYEYDINQYVKNEIELHKKEISASFINANTSFVKQMDLFNKIHENSLKTVQENKNIDLEELKKSINNNYELGNIAVEIFLIDKDYTIFKTTYPKDLGFNLNFAGEAKDFLDKTKKDGKIYIPNFVATDALNMQHKIYSYSKLDEETFFELGFLSKSNNNTFLEIISENIKSKNNIKVYNLGKNANGYYYYDMTTARLNNKSKEEFFRTVPVVKKEEITNIPITNAGLNFVEIKNLDKNILTVYSPVFSNNVFNISGFENVVMELKIDLKEKLEFIESMEQLFFSSIILIGLFLSIVFIFIKKRFTNPTEKILKSLVEFQRIEDKNILNLNNELTDIAFKYNSLFDKLNSEINANKTLLEENKRFIADTVHQIRTPLTNIMMNGEMVKKFQNDETLSVFIDQIDASINMLSNSYEDLAYLISCDYLEYKASDIDISRKLKERIKFFNTISNVNKKELITNIDENLITSINEIELERIIDNNISNAIKYATKELPIEINLIKKEGLIKLQFVSYGIEIENKTSIFEKNYREHNAKRGLGLGLNMVKNICEKYEIEYKTYYEVNRNIFEYIFKNKD